MLPGGVLVACLLPECWQNVTKFFVWERVSEERVWWRGRVEGETEEGESMNEDTQPHLSLPYPLPPKMFPWESAGIPSESPGRPQRGH